MPYEVEVTNVGTGAKVVGVVEAMPPALEFTRRRYVRGRILYNKLRRWAKLADLRVESPADPAIVAKVYGRRVQREAC